MPVFNIHEEGDILVITAESPEALESVGKSIENVGADGLWETVHYQVVVPKNAVPMFREVGKFAQEAAKLGKHTMVCDWGAPATEEELAAVLKKYGQQMSHVKMIKPVVRED